jgi:hypothetical protein
MINTPSNHACGIGLLNNVGYTSSHGVTFEIMLLCKDVGTPLSLG